MKLNMKVFKKGKPIYWIIGAVVVFALFYFMFNRGGTTTVSAGGKSEALQAAELQSQTQLALAQGQLNLEGSRIAGELQAAGLAAQVQTANIMAQENVALAQLEHEGVLGMAALDAQKQIAFLSSQTAIEQLNISTQGALRAKEIDASILLHQMETNKDMFAMQTKALATQAAFSSIQFTAEADRDNALALVLASQTGMPISYRDRGSGSFSTYGALAPQNDGGSGGGSFPVFGAIGSFF